jgi:hypothetical protein
MSSPAVVAALAAVAALLPALAVAQEASPRTDTQLQMETTRRRVIVRPDPPVAQAFEDAARVADELTLRRLTEQAGARVRAPQLDEDVTRSLQTQNLRRALRR